MSYRDLPPVNEPVDAPARLSQTLLGKADACMRSAFLYLRHHGGAPAGNLDFGTAAHLCWERMMLDLIAHGERTLYAPAEGEDPAAAALEVASLSAAVVDEVLRERPGLQVSKLGADRLRVLAFHWAMAQPVDPESVVAVERKFVLDLECGWAVSGKVDLAHVLSPDALGITDYKSSFPPAADESEPDEFFQLRFYSLLVLFGQPVEDVPCPRDHATITLQGEPMKWAVRGPGEEWQTCPECEGRGTVEQRLAPIGDGINYVRPKLVYPRVLRQDGELHRRPETGVLTRTQVADFRADVERDAEKVAAALESGLWPAVPGSHCSMCPCPVECPLPEELRQHAGTINTVEECAEALEWADRTAAEVGATKREARRFVEAHGPVRWGADRETLLEAGESWKTDWVRLEEGVLAAVEYGEPFDLSMVRTRQVSTKLKTRTLKGPELVGSAEERFGAEAPF